MQHRILDQLVNGLGFVNIQPLGALSAGTILIGYATKLKHANEDYPPLEYRVAKVSTAGEVLATKKLEGMGWGEEDVWVRRNSRSSVAAHTPSACCSRREGGAIKCMPVGESGHEGGGAKT